jgi:hypothetical protein
VPLRLVNTPGAASPVLVPKKTTLLPVAEVTARESCVVPVLMVVCVSAIA